MSGWLQLPDGTHLLVDETKMNAGVLQEQGVRNMADIHSLTLRQEVNYDFNYFRIPFHTNIPVLVLSEGKSMIPVNYYFLINSFNFNKKNSPTDRCPFEITPRAGDDSWDQRDLPSCSFFPIWT